MKYFVGLDVSMKLTSVCIMDETVKVVHESEVTTNPKSIANRILLKKFDIKIVGLESGAVSHYLVKELTDLGIPVVCVDARKMNLILSININKTDKNDAKGIANAMRTDMFTAVHPKPQKDVDRSTVLAMRKKLIQSRTDLKKQ